MRMAGLAPPYFLILFRGFYMYKGKIYLRDCLKTLHRTFTYKDNGFPYSGIWIFSGGQGMGKTLNAVQCLLEIHKKYPLARIISNIPLDIDCVETYTGLEMFDETNGSDGIIYFLDEIQSLYSSMQSKGVSDEMLYIWAQNRKNRRVILGTTQRFTRVAKPIREQTKWLFDMRFKLFNIFGYRIYDGYDFNDNGEYCGERPAMNFCMPSDMAYSVYDTRYVVRRVGGALDD